ncbi:hypothetical protein B0H13DRAFT_2342927 [Mycena leptocephala]|nr:hypothetical protein B0H13DRAFT_2342927 [Mycena leptocephala]
MFLNEEKLGAFLTKSTVLGDFLRALGIQDDEIEMRTESLHPVAQAPDDDGEDLSDAQLTSGSGLVFTVHPETGLLVIEDERRGRRGGGKEEEEETEEETEEMEGKSEEEHDESE